MDLEDYRLGVGAIIVNRNYDSLYLFERIDHRGIFQFPEGGLDYANIFTADGEKIEVKIKNNSVLGGKPNEILSVFVGGKEITNSVVFSEISISGKIFKFGDNSIEIPPKVNYRFNIDNINIIINIRKCRTCLVCDFYRIGSDNRPIYETPIDGILREIYEEVGLDSKYLELVNETGDFITYDFNSNKSDVIKFFRSRGQAKKFFAFKYVGNGEPNFDFLSHGEQEFVDFIKIPIVDFLNKIDIVPSFKVEFYRKIFSELFKTKS